MSLIYCFCFWIKSDKGKAAFQSSKPGRSNSLLQGMEWSQGDQRGSNYNEVAGGAEEGQQCKGYIPKVFKERKNYSALGDEMKMWEDSGR